MGLGFFVHHGDKALGKLVFTAAAHIEIADNRERERTDKVDEKVLHRIQQANIQVAAQTKGRLGAVTLHHDHIRDIADDAGIVTAGGVQHHAANGVDHGILLHIQQKQLVHGTLKKFPDHANRHGKAECHNGQVQRGERKADLFLPVEDIKQREPDGRAQKAVQGVQHGIPIGEGNVIGVNLAQDFRRIDKQQDDNFQRIWQFNVQPVLHHVGHAEQEQRQHTQKDIFKVAVKDLGNQHQNDRGTQQQVNDGNRALVLPGIFQLAQTAGARRGWYVFQIGHEISVLQAEIFGVIMRQFLPVRHAQQRVIPELAAGKIGRNHAPVFAQNHFLVSRRRAVGAVSTRRRDFCAIGRLFEHPLSSNTARFGSGSPRAVCTAAVRCRNSIIIRALAGFVKLIQCSAQKECNCQRRIPRGTLHNDHLRGQTGEHSRLPRYQRKAQVQQPLQKHKMQHPCGQQQPQRHRPLQQRRQLGKHRCPQQAQAQAHPRHAACSSKICAACGDFQRSVQVRPRTIRHSLPQHTAHHAAEHRAAAHRQAALHRIADGLWEGHALLLTAPLPSWQFLLWQK